MRARILAAVNSAPTMAAVYLTVTVAAGSAVAALEGWAWGDGLWWAIATTTTVGYGDLSPETLTGRVIGACTMWLGIFVIGITVGRIASVVIRTRDDWTHEEQEASRDREERMLAALTGVAALLRDNIATTHRSMVVKPKRTSDPIDWLTESQRGLGWRLITEDIPPVGVRVLVRQRELGIDSKAAAGVVTQNHGVPASSSAVRVPAFSSTVRLEDTGELVQLDGPNYAWREYHVYDRQERTT